MLKISIKFKYFKIASFKHLYLLLIIFIISLLEDLYRNIFLRDLVIYILIADRNNRSNNNQRIYHMQKISIESL